MINRTENTVLLLRDNWPDYDMEESLFIEETLKKAGYTVRITNVDEFLTKKNIYNFHSFMLIVPQCNNLPIETVDKLRRFNNSAGSVLFIGGPLYYHRIERDGDGFKNVELKDMLDASFTLDKPFVREGIAPSYKTFATKGVTELETLENHNIFTGKLKVPHPIDVSVPCQTGIGGGYITDSQNRFIPLVDCRDANSSSTDPIERGRCAGSRGAFAFIELQRTMGDGYEGVNDYGIIYNTAIGSAAAMIGVENCRLQNIEGADELLVSIANKFNQGIYLFEGGASGLVFRDGESMRVGAQILNTTIRFVKVRVEIEVETEDEPLKFSTEKLVAIRTIADVNFDISAEQLRALGLRDEKDYKITTRLFVKDELVDEIVSTYTVEHPVPETDKSKFVFTKDDYFVIGDKPWYLAGINYWSTYNPALEKPFYWLGQFDRSNYSQENVENDLSYMEEIGLNCVLTRLDITDIDRSVHGMRDFLIRCRRHGIRVMMAVVKATASKFYCPEAVDEVFSKIFIGGNPTVMAIDMEWETHDNQHHFIETASEFNDEWQAWLEKKYGSVERAEEVYGTKLPRDIYGYPYYPMDDMRPDGNYNSFGRKAGYDIRCFVNECINSYWEKLMAHLKPLIPNQMTTFRHGGICTDGPAQAKDYIDFTPLETYGFYGYEDDIHNPENRIGGIGVIASGSLIQKYETGGKPVIWAEYGYSVCGVKWLGVQYDHTNRTYLPEKIEKQVLFNRWMIDSIEEAHCAGSAPWWWCGGFRYTEMADFGYMMPNGVFSASGKEYVAFCNKMTAKAGMPDTREAHVFEGNVVDYPKGKFDFIKNECVPQFRKAYAEGKRLVIKTKYEE